MKVFGLIGHPISHSFSQKYFSQKFEREGIAGYEYLLFDLPLIASFPALINSRPNIVGLNVTIPYKEKIIPYLDGLDESAQQTGAVNVIKLVDGQLIGYNSDAFGFAESLNRFLPENKNQMRALVLGSGGASKAVKWALKEFGIDFSLVSRGKGEGAIRYEDLDESIMKSHQLVVNTTPLGMYPKTEETPSIPFQWIDDRHYIFDVVYNPEETLLMRKALAQGAKVKNGLEMLHLQAEKAWEIWNR